MAITFTAPASGGAPANVRSVSVDAGRLLQTGVAAGARLGANVDYWWDHQANRVAGARPLAASLTDMGAKYWRYPGGEKSDGYLWSLAPFLAPDPRLARTGPGDWPANDPRYWTGGTQASGAFTHPVYDFDQFMADCRAAGCTPVIVVAYDGIYKPPAGGDSLTRQQALDTSAAWVDYANNAKHYGIRYWEIGNETYNPGYMGGDPGRAAQANDFIAFCDDMKGRDPTISCGINTGSRADWQMLLSIARSRIGFLDVHEYESYRFGSYAGYVAGPYDPGARVDDAWIPLQAYPEDAARIEILVGETGGITFGMNGSWTAADLGHALMSFENQAMLQQDPRVKASLFWTTRWVEQAKTNTWPGYSESEYDLLKPDNSLSPQGWAMKLLSAFSLDDMVGTAGTADVHVYASTGASGGMNVWLVNRASAPAPTTLTLQNYVAPATASLSVFEGAGDADTFPTFLPDAGTVAVAANAIDLTLAPVSITIVQLAGCPDTAPPAVTAPLPVTVDQSVCCGVSGGATPASSAPLAAFLAGGSAVDDCDPSPARLAAQAGGTDVVSTTCLGAGSTTVAFRFQDRAGNIGTATSAAMVRIFGDLNLDFTVDPADFVVLRGYLNFAAVPGAAPFLAPLAMADLDHDSVVDPSDTVLFRAYMNYVVTCLAP